MIKDNSTLNIRYWTLFQIIEFLEIFYLLFNSIGLVILKIKGVSAIISYLNIINDYFVKSRTLMMTWVFNQCMKHIMNRQFNNLANQNIPINDPPKKTFVDDREMMEFLDEIDNALMSKSQ